MKNWIMALAAAVVLAPFAWAGDKHEGKGHGDHHEHAAAGASHTIEGNIVDMACYMSHGEMDAEHSKCAKACVAKGMPAGILGADGVLYLLLENHENPKAYGAVKKLAGEKAKVTGSVVEKNGIKGLVVSGAEKAK
ncbi:MAG: hypothetical protein HY925_16510 [Elusimicrobia bacterium]|nr:hypothetical protein [Elusimicrobiota bacterium]